MPDISRLPKQARCKPNCCKQLSDEYSVRYSYPPKGLLDNAHNFDWLKTIMVELAVEVNGLEYKGVDLGGYEGAFRCADRGYWYFGQFNGRNEAHGYAMEEWGDWPLDGGRAFSRWVDGMKDGYTLYEWAHGDTRFYHYVRGKKEHCARKYKDGRTCEFDYELCDAAKLGNFEAAALEIKVDPPRPR